MARLGARHGAPFRTLHACVHNPTGVEPTLEQWEQIRQLIRSKSILPFFYSAYQVCRSADMASKVESQLKLVIMPMYSSPPIHGASIVATILKDRDTWRLEPHYKANWDVYIHMS
uniref:Aminotransferase class I/classII large domain-containing protein n=1 Tax=Lactuca sativa TaxID=4236 RepID=A0A9R1XWA5_LACSA|nr:hypothetical protein LSAT_V11C200091160 [Lactuca sativa]